MSQGVDLRWSPWLLVAEAKPKVQPAWDEPWLQLALWGGITLFCGAVIAAGVVLLHGRLADGTVALLRFLGFAFLHVTDYATNWAVILILIATGHAKYVAVLLPVHGIISLLCLYTAACDTNWRRWGYPMPMNVLFMGVVLGLMQGVQVKFALDDYRQQSSARSGETMAELPMPSMMPARYNCKTLDGILEGTVFTFVVMHTILKRNWEFVFKEWQASIMYGSAFLSLLTIGLALMELDHRTSTAVQRELDRSGLAQVRHLFFRSSEVTHRLVTILIFTVFSQPLESHWWLSYACLGVDYLAGLALILTLGGRDHLKAMAALGIPLMAVNIMQFVDAPGVSLQARRISRLVVPMRSAEALGVLAFCYYFREHIHPVRHRDGADDITTWIFLWMERTPVIVIWVLSAVVYHYLLVTYAWRLKPGADLHSAVAYGDVESLRQLLKDSELVLDINRYGPDGRTPLHLATIHGNIDIMRLLVEEGANLNARTSNRSKNTLLHLAAANKDPEVARFLCAACSRDVTLLNAQNADGNTAVHIASLKQNVGALRELLTVPGVDFKSRNAKGQTPGDCAHNKFGFDRNSPESAIAELLSQAHTGAIRGGPASERLDGGGMELTEMKSPSPTGPASAGAGEADAARPENAQESSAQAQAAPEGNLSFADAKHSVPLNTIDMAQEEAFLSRQSGLEGRSMKDPVLMSKCGISSFMLSAGLGAMSRSIASPIPEEAEYEEEPSEFKIASFEDFEEIKPLGEGVFGKVVKVKHKQTGEVFAMKLMNKAKFKAQKITSTAHSEQFILKTTRHPFVVTLHYAFQGSSFWALVMEFCPNGDLQNQLGMYGTPEMPFDLGTRFAGEVLLALEHLHSINVIFRDLKLENVVVDKDYRARVTDFGLAKKLNDASDAKTMCGSYGYAAPEIMMNVGKYTYAVDLYSYGVLLFMLASGGDPSPKNSKQRMPPMKHAGLRKKLDQAGRSLAAQEPKASWARHEGLLDLLNRLTHDDAKQRPSAAEVKRDVYFARALGRSVDCLLQEGPFRPAPLPGEPQEP